MKTDGLFIIMVIIFIFVAWVATGGPTRPISQAGPFLTPVTRPGEESQGYRLLAPTNPIDTASYPKQVVGGSAQTISSGPDAYTRSTSNSPLALEHSLAGPSAANPNQQYVILVNGSAQSVSAGGWRLASRATGASAIIPDAGTIPPDGTEVVVVGRSFARQLPSGLCDGPTDICVYLNRSLPLFGQSRETITLIDAKGDVADTYSY